MRGSISSASKQESSVHDSVMIFGIESLTVDDVRSKSVLEVGSMNVNGSLRGHVCALGPLSYVGVDFMVGKGVDVVCDASRLEQRFGKDAFDVVISTEMLEHAEDWRGAIFAMKSVLRPGGILLLTARGPGFPLHGYPHDWHRFTVHDFRRMFADFEICVLKDDPQHPGVLLLSRKLPSWQAAHLADIDVAQADAVNAPR
jgi:SAM-dependent methyltransferase